MRSLLVNHSYFGIGDWLEPQRWLQGLIHPYCCQQRCRYHGKELMVRWTRRAQQGMEMRELPLVVEMQLYFSCMVKKRVLFHRQGELDDANAIHVNPQLSVMLRSVQADRCDPEEFAQHYPTGRLLDAPATRKLSPKRLDIDFRGGQWHGVFEI